MSVGIVDIFAPVTRVTMYMVSARRKIAQVTIGVI